ncbi:Uncharacterised protein [Clostridioides difficile]|uniref:Uncharacterized protein n=1 Tax=Clostridioides difficile ATCC 9689 = DSM 1296 TaxID=1121308 RepID=A0AC59FV26_CLODI|nr:hypothetical protein [Clostridioides difficile]AKP41224.1 hypothetical protein CDIF1296T_00326 [Clostridioides difficile ATCC 9689 = DSM 1296]EQH07513.1 hypothetical protein QKQ_0259 [Clostridioides difficile DA00196]EQI53885.1 hypothetical protein QQ5_0206 [Clostridioides difficile Y270]EQJ95099.1 hypothetical protein QUC_0267 [Clostridioides difficile P50]MCZ1130696.1 hypothetical protein [Clostridioides difficile]
MNNKKKYTLTITEELYNKCKEKANQKGMSVNEYILLVISNHI